MRDYNYCIGCGRKFHPVRSDQMFHSKRCRLNHYKPNKRDIKCSECGNRSDKYGQCELWKTFKGKTHPRSCDI